MTHKKDTKVRSCYHIQDIIDASENVHIEYILFCYVFQQFICLGKYLFWPNSKVGVN